MGATAGDDAEWVGSLPFSSNDSFWGRVAMLGGTLSLTEDCVVFKPLWGLGRVRQIRLEDLEAVVSGGDRPPRLRLVTSDAKPLVLMLGPRRLTPVWTRDTGARDEALTAISAASRARRQA